MTIWVLLDEGSRRIHASAIGSEPTLFEIDAGASQPRWSWLPFSVSALSEPIPGPLRRFQGQPDHDVTCVIRLSILGKGIRPNRRN